MGKTHASRYLVAVPGHLVLIHDDSKAQPEYDARYFATIDEAAAVSPQEAQTLTAVGFRGDPFRSITIEVEQVAAWALEHARRGTPVKLVVAEISRAMSDSGKALESPALKYCLTQGRTMGLCVDWSAQTPQEVPFVAYTQSSSIACFQLEPPALNYLDSVHRWDPDMLATAQKLQRGEFVLRQPATPWDRTVYKFR
jgi:hypothetical protein